MAVHKIRFMHCADIHIDYPFCDRGHDGYSDMRRRDVRKTFENAIRLSVAGKVDFILISGDLYEHRYSPKSTIEWVSGLFKKLPVPVVIIPGNHDPYAANSWYRLWEWPENVFILSGERPFINLEALDTYIYGIGFSAFNQDKPDLSGVNPPDPDKFNIMMFHGALDIDMGKPYNPVSSEELSKLGFDYYALGHYHNRITELKTEKAAIPGSPEPLGFDEKGAHGVLIVTLERGFNCSKKLSLEKRDTAVREYVERVIDITRFKNPDEIKQKISGALTELDGDKCLTRVILKGRASCEVDTRALEEELSAGRAYLRVKNESRVNTDYDALACEDTLKGAFVREILGRIKKCEETGANERIAILTGALELGIEALETGRIDASFD